MFNSVSSSFALGRRPAPVTIPATPLNVPNNTIWYNADISNNTNFQNPPANGGKIGQWTDRSGLAHNINASGNARPTWQSNIQNAYGVARFDGTTNVMTINPITFMQSLAGYTMFIVAKASTLSGTRYLSSTDTNGFSFAYNGSFWSVLTAGGTGTSTIAGDTTNFHTFCIIYDGSQTGNAARLRFRYDRSDQVLSYTGTVGATTNAAAKYWYLGADNTGAANFFGGDIGEVLMYTRALTPSEVIGTELYLKNHWAI